MRRRGQRVARAREVTWDDAYDVVVVGAGAYDATDERYGLTEWEYETVSALYESPMISRVHSLEHPVELEAGMVFALETCWAATDGRSAARIERWS